MHYLSQDIYFSELGNVAGTKVQSQVGSDVRGRIIDLQIAVNGQRLIEKARCKVHGCGYTMAAAAYICEQITSKAISEAYKLDSKTIALALDLPNAKIYAAVLAEDAVKTAINQFLRGEDYDR